MLSELWATCMDAARYGDWRGHLAAWRAVFRGEITPETRSDERAQARCNWRIRLALWLAWRAYALLLGVEPASAHSLFGSLVRVLRVTLLELGRMHGIGSGMEWDENRTVGQPAQASPSS